MARSPCGPARGRAADGGGWLPGAAKPFHRVGAAGRKDRADRRTFARAPLLHDNTQPMVHSFHSSGGLRSDDNSSAIGEIRLWRHDDNVAVIQPLLYLNSSLCLLTADDANALNDTFSDCPHIGFTFLNTDGTFRNCDTRSLRRRWLTLQEAHFDTHFRLNDSHVRLVERNLHFDRAFLPIRLRIEFDERRLKAAVSISIRHDDCW